MTAKPINTKNDTKNDLSARLSPSQTALLSEAFPGARLVSVEQTPEAWMLFGPRVTLALAGGGERTVDFWGDLDPARAALLPVLERLGVPAPRLIHGPTLGGEGYLSLCEPPRGQNLSLWTLGGTPHRIRRATECAFAAIARLQALTADLQADPAGASLPRRTLLDEIAILTDDARWQADPWLAEAGAARREWLRDPWFAAALARTQAAAADIRDPLVFTNYLHFFPQAYRIVPAQGDPSAGPGNPHAPAPTLAEFVYPYGHYGDPLLGLAMVWVYDCYPFVHTGYVEQFLWRRDVTRRDFAPRLALKALQMVARDLPVTRPAEGGDYWDGLRGWVQMALGWM